MNIPSSAHDRTISLAIGKFAFDNLQEELNALYALSLAALHDLEPKDGEEIDELPHFVGFQLVKLLNERLERAGFINSMRELLAPGQASATPAALGEIT